MSIRAAQSGSYEHAEAFCLMKYRSDDSREEEIVWNSRDGVTPFVISLRSGKSAHHVDWQADERRTDFVPPVGSRIFVDLTEARSRELAVANAVRFFEKYKGSELDPRKTYSSVEEMAVALHSDYATYGSPQAPDLIEVTEEVQRRFVKSQEK